MNILSVSPFLGFSCTIVLFLFCLFIVGFLKVIYLSLIDRFFKPQIAKKRQYKKRKKTNASTPTPKPIRSIEINPEEIDRIYVKKSS